MAAKATSGVGDVIQMTVKYTILGGLIAGVFTAIASIITAFTTVDTGNAFLDTIITTGLVLLVGLAMVAGVIKVIAPKAAKWLDF